MNKPTKRCVSVYSTQRLSPNMQRIIFSGEGLNDFPLIKPGAYIKLMFDEDGSAFADPTSKRNHAMTRTYTIRAFERETTLLTVDFALHGEQHASGPASRWAKSAKVGDKICFGGPGSIKDFPTNYDWVVFAGDITSLPAIESQLALLPDDTIGFAIIAIEHSGDIRDLVKPEGVKLTWLTTPYQRLANTLSQINRPRGKPAVWAASEFSQMREMRSLFNDEWHLPRNSYYLSSYWKVGRSEEQHKIEKRKDAAKEGLNPANLYKKAKQMLVS